jgi:TPR repeat protein
MKLLKIVLIAVAALILTPIVLMHAFNLYISYDNRMRTPQPVAAAPAPTPGARDCARMRHNRPSAWDVGDERYRQFMKDWITTCEREAAVDVTAPVQLSWFSALFATDRRPEAIVVLRKLAATGDADALLEIYQWHRSWEPEDLGKTQIVDTREAHDALRKAAEAGHPRAIQVLAIDLDQGRFVKRDVDAAAHWMERAMARPHKDSTPADLAISTARLLSESADPEKRARGIRMLEQANRPNAKGYLAIAIRKDDPVRARALFEETLRAWPGISLPPLADMLIKGEGGPADGKRALKLLQSYSSKSAPSSINAALGRLYAEGTLVPRDPHKAAELMSGETQWSVTANIAFAQFLADNPSVKPYDAKRVLYEITEATELGEPGAMTALAALKLSANPDFADKSDGCSLAARAAQTGDERAKALLTGCSVN